MDARPSHVLLLFTILCIASAMCTYHSIPLQGLVTTVCYGKIHPCQYEDGHSLERTNGARQTPTFSGHLGLIEILKLPFLFG